MYILRTCTRYRRMQRSWSLYGVVYTSNKLGDDGPLIVPSVLNSSGVLMRR